VDGNCIETPLIVALEEYRYWHDGEDARSKLNQAFRDLGIGAMAAAGNIASRIAGGRPQGIRWPQMSEGEVKARAHMLANAEETLQALEGLTAIGLNHEEKMAAYGKAIEAVRKARGEEVKP
jgi:hypothetical protein